MFIGRLIRIVIVLALLYPAHGVQVFVVASRTQGDSGAVADIATLDTKILEDITVIFDVLNAGSVGISLGAGAANAAVNHIVIGVGETGFRRADNGKELHQKGQYDEDGTGAAN